MNSRVYAEKAVESGERLLTTMDRNKESPTYGCFSRPYWHDKTTDFPSAHQQIGVLPLTLLYKTDFEGNYFYKSESVRAYIDAAVEFWSKIQRQNGSFDEHYPNEHSVGAVAWTLWSITESQLVLENPPNIDEEVRKSVDFLQRNDEPGELANHQAVAINALLNAERITDRGLKEAKERMSTLEEMQHKEGWFKEYKGADIGYQSTTLSHLGHIWKKNREIVDRSMIQKGLEFFSSFIDDSNYYAGNIGSRHTKHIHPSGFEVLADDFELAEKICGSIRKNKDRGKLLEPYQIDDKHFSRELSEYLLAYQEASKINKSLKSVDEKTFEPIRIRKDGRETYFINTSKGGAIDSYREGKLVERDTGVAVKDKGVYTSNWPDSTICVSEKEGKLKVVGELRKVPRNTLPHAYFMLYRLFCYTLGRSSFLSLNAKDFLIRLLIREKSSNKSFERIIDLETGEVSNSVNGKEVKGEVRSNFVPSSEFFSKELLRH